MAAEIRIKQRFSENLRLEKLHRRHWESGVFGQALLKAESDELLNFLIAHAERPEFAYSHKWRVGDTLVWDNCASIHLATGGYDSSTPRLMHRVQVLGNEGLYRQHNKERGGRLHA